MTSTATFGRRQPPACSAPPAQAKPVEAEDARLEALRREMVSFRGADSGFQSWRRDQQLGRWLSWFATFALLTPGVLCFMAHAPRAVSSLLEIAGIVGGWWLRRARSQRLSAIRDWSPDEFA